MALRNFKDIVDSKGYRIETRDREIFERGDLQTFFGFSNNDAIEVIIYDANDNQLPQANFGLVRYIPLTTENIRDYFLIADGTIFQMYKFPSEYFIDVERIIKEAGYDNGIFKTQITLINHRVGSNKKYDKLWIGEISPSRTEVRLFPLRRAETEGTDLFERYNIFLRDGEFREDTITYAINLIEEINPTLISTFIKEKYSENWYNKLKTEFNIQNFEAFCANVYKKFVESALFEFTNRISDPKDLNYGKPKNTPPPLELSKSTIKGLCSSLIVRAIDYYLSTPVVRLASEANVLMDESMDIVTQVRQTKESDVIIDTTRPELKVIERKKAVVKETDLILEELKKKEIILPPPPLDVIDLPELPDPPIEFIQPGPTTDVIVPPITITETPVPSGGGGGGGGAGGFVERDFGTGFGRERVVDDNLVDRQNLQ